MIVEMTSLMDSIASVAALVPKALVGFPAIGMRLAPRPPAEPVFARLDARTYRDIGVEPGSLTWIG